MVASANGWWRGGAAPATSVVPVLGVDTHPDERSPTRHLRHLRCYGDAHSAQTLREQPSWSRPQAPGDEPIPSPRAPLGAGLPSIRARHHSRL